MNFLEQEPFWIRTPRHYEMSAEKLTIVTEAGTDLWQRTYYGFRNDNAPLLLLRSENEYFSFTVRCSVNGRQRYDQSGLVLYQDSENWIKASVEYENEELHRLGSVVTNRGYSDWATMDISAEIKELWYRLSRRQSDYLIESSLDGAHFQQIRLCHLEQGKGPVQYGVYACSPLESSFEAQFSELVIRECLWPAHEA